MWEKSDGKGPSSGSNSGGQLNSLHIPNEHTWKDPWSNQGEILGQPRPRGFPQAPDSNPGGSAGILRYIIVFSITMFLFTIYK